MGARPLTDLGLTMLASLPPKVRNSIDYQAVIHAASREVALLEGSIETLRAQFNPATADVLLNAWESMLKLPVGGPAGASVSDRRNLVLGRLRKLVTTGAGSQWEETITNIVGHGWSYFERSPGDGQITITLPYPPGSSQFVDVSNQIRDITDAHLVVNFASTVVFRLDTDPMDSTEFGA